MKTLSNIQATLDRFSEKYDLPNMKDAPQGSAGWFQTKLGVISASNADKVLAKVDSQTRATYMAELVAQVCTGHIEEVNSKHMEWGKNHEDAARALYEFENNTIVTLLPFVFKDSSWRVGCSPDALVTDSKGMEIKCPYNPTHYIQFLTADRIKPEYEYQVQFTMWVLDAHEWDMVQYHPSMARNQIKTLNIKRNAETFKRFDEAVPKFIEDMDKMLAKAGFKFGEQWSRIAAASKAEAAS